MKKSFLVSVVILLCVNVLLIAQDDKTVQVKLDSYVFGALEARSIGPAVMRSLSVPASM